MEKGKTVGIRERQRQAWLHSRHKNVSLANIMDAMDGLDFESMDAMQLQYLVWEIRHYMHAFLNKSGSTMEIMVDTYRPQIIPPEIEAGRVDDYLDYALDDYGVAYDAGGV